MPIYTLYLRTDTTTTNQFSPVKRSTYGQSITWLINFDDLFKNQNYEFKNCRITSQMGWSYILQTLLYDNMLNYMTISLSSSYSGSTTNGEVIDILNAVDYDIGTGGNNKWNSNTFGSKGADFNMPYGTTFLTLNFLRLSGFLPISNTTSAFEYGILFKFELY